LNKYWNYIVLNNSVRDWLIAIGIVVGAIVLLRLFQALIVKKLKSFSPAVVQGWLFVGGTQSSGPL
jgi:hypothetical protein